MLSLHTGELESLTVLLKDETLVYCSCDAATIKVLPLLDLSDRGISPEELLRQSGLSKGGLQDRHTTAYFRENILRGKEQKIYSTDLSD